MDFASMSLEDLAGLIADASAEIHKRQLEAFKNAPCDCDRYTCWNCQQYSALKRGHALGIAIKPMERGR